jgi:hypothetical protein
MVPIRAGGRFLALAYSYEYARPGRAVFSNPEIWILESNDGNEWKRSRQVRSANLQPSYFQRECIPGPWMVNPDIARDRTGRYFATRAYSDNYAGCGVTFPNRVQVYSAADETQLFNGRWLRVADLGCAELGFQPDSAQIVHDGLGNVVEKSGGSVTLDIAISGGNREFSLCGRTIRYPGSCGSPPPQRIQEVTIATAP